MTKIGTIEQRFHAHRISTERMRGFSLCVGGHLCVPEAHGCVRYEQLCACGATRLINVNQNWIERGNWKVTPEKDA